MKIPGAPNGVKSTAIPTPYANTDTRGAFGASFGQALDKVDGAIDAVRAEKKREDAEAARQAEEAKRQAKAISKAQADAAYFRAETEVVVGGSNRRNLIDQAFETGFSHAESFGPNVSVAPNLLSPADVKETPGFLATRGKDAYAKSGEAIDAVRKRAEQIAKDNFADPADREEWLAHNLGALTNTERRIEAHAAQQFEVARKDAAEGIRAAALDGIATATDAATAAEYTRAAEARLRELAPSQEGAAADVAKFRQDALGVRIAKMLSDGDVAGAEQQYELAKTHFGTTGPKVKAAIDAAKKAQGVQKFDVEAQQRVDALVEAGTKPNGQPDFQVMDAKMETIPAGPLRDEVEQRMTHAKTKAARRWDARVSREYDGALSTYLQAGSLSAVDPKAKSWLIENAPEEWAKLKAKERADASYWRNLREGKQEVDPRPLVAAKADIDERADYYRSLTPEAFFREPAVQGLNPNALKEVGNYWAGMRKRDPIPDGEFNRDVSARIGQSPALQKDKAAAQAYRARMNQERLEYLKNNNNKEPDYAERDAMDDRATREVVVGKKWGFFDDKRPAYTVPAAGPAAGPAFGPPASAKPATSPKNAAALAWARANPADPRAAAILKKLGVK